MEDSLLGKLTNQGYQNSEVFAIKLAFEEALSNAIKHGSHYDSKKHVQIVLDIDSKRVILGISDQGQGFDLSKVPDPTTDENLEKPTGRGIMLMKAYMDEVTYNKKGNQVRMVKFKNQKSL